MRLCVKVLPQAQKKSSFPQSENKLNAMIVRKREGEKKQTKKIKTKISNVKQNQHVYQNRF